MGEGLWGPGRVSCVDPEAPLFEEPPLPAFDFDFEMLDENDGFGPESDAPQDQKDVGVQIFLWMT